MTLARRSTRGDRAKVIAIENASIANPLFPDSILGNYKDLLMLKFTSLAVGLLTAISIVPAAQARPIYDNTPVIIQQSRDVRTPVVVKVIPQTRQDSGYRQGWKANRYRQMELAREREARARWEAAHSRNGRYDSNYRSYNDRYNDRHDYRR